MLKIEGDTLVIDRTGFDHIMEWEGSSCPSKTFELGLIIEKDMFNIKNGSYKKIEIRLD